MLKDNFKKGKRDLISDVPGVRVGHKTISDGDIQTGVTIIDPSIDNIFKNKYIAASYVINGFGKTSGLVQIDELGTLESKIALTNTLNVGAVQQALVKHMLVDNPEIGVSTGTINVVVGECNDGYLNDIRGCHVSQQDVYDAIKDVTEDFKQGAVGAGTGMSCFEMKGGIGSASRIVTLDNEEYVVGSLVLTNFGLQKDFIKETTLFSDEDIEKGSIIIVLATNIPLDARQLKRICKRVPIALGQLGSHLGNGSGDIVIAFTTGNIVPHDIESEIITQKVIHENKIDMVFRATIEATRNAILASLEHAKTTVGRDGNIRYNIKEVDKN